MKKYFVGHFDEEKAVKFCDVEVGEFFIDEDEELMMKIDQLTHNAVSISRNIPGYVNFYQFTDDYECCVVSIDVEIIEVI